MLCERLAVLGYVLVILQIALVNRPLADRGGEFYVFWLLILRIELVEGVAERLWKAGIRDCA